MQRFLWFTLGCHRLPIATGCFAGTVHIDNARRVCLWCTISTVGHDRHLSLSVMPWLLCGLSVQACSQAALTPEGHFLLSLII